MDPLVRIDVIEEAANLLQGIAVIQILGQVHLHFFDRAQETLGISVLPGLACISHTDLHINSVKHSRVGCRRKLRRLPGIWLRTRFGYGKDAL